LIKLLKEKDKGLRISTYDRMGASNKPLLRL
jgi:hypothetical protein